MSAIDRKLLLHERTCTIYSSLVYCNCGVEEARKELATLKARIAELEAMTTWQPIETCPEKTDVLLLIPSISGLHVEQGEKIRNQYFALYGYSREFEPTHWMPVPKTPEEQK